VTVKRLLKQHSSYSAVTYLVHEMEQKKHKCMYGYTMTDVFYEFCSRNILVNMTQSFELFHVPLNTARECGLKCYWTFKWCLSNWP